MTIVIPVGHLTAIVYPYPLAIFALQPIVGLVRQYFQRYIESFGLSFEEILEALRIREGEPPLTANLAMRGSGYANGVSRLHGSVSREIFQHLYERWLR